MNSDNFNSWDQRLGSKSNKSKSKKTMKKKTIKIKHPGALHKELGVSETKKLTVKELVKAKNSKSPIERKRATFAVNAKKWNHKKKKI